MQTVEILKEVDLAEHQILLPYTKLGGGFYGSKMGFVLSLLRLQIVAFG